MKTIFPEKSSTFSSDYLKTKEKTKKLFKDINENKIDILVGTQMISKGFNFPKLNCIVVIDADFSEEVKILELQKKYSIVSAIKRKSQRFSSESLIVYQTLNPQDITLNELIKNKSDELQNELKFEKKNKLPPFIRLISSLYLQESVI